jgi:hypothetical protein
MSRRINGVPGTAALHHHLLHGLLVRAGYSSDDAARIAFRFLTGKSLPPAEYDAAEAAMAPHLRRTDVPSR